MAGPLWLPRLSMTTMSPRLRDKELLDIGFEARAVDRSVEHPRGIDAVGSQNGDEGERSPVSVGYFGDQPLTASVSSVGAVFVEDRGSPMIACQAGASSHNHVAGRVTSGPMPADFGTGASGMTVRKVRIIINGATG